MAERRSPNTSRINLELDDNPRHRAPLLNRLPPFRTTLCAIMFLVMGTVFLCLGGSILWASGVLHNDRGKGVSFMVLGGLMFLPGSYACTIIYGTWVGWQGYDYNMIPSYDE